ncbi:enoyl-CoA hydratase-related protein [Actinocorallia longicatena]|uniref:Enoyl-CoA hydratase/isomerase family protein n=1 Tax=Actinocorallia longicatena TaxID=111803 RepID=A0ABP6Q5E4_9ACTN
MEAQVITEIGPGDLLAWLGPGGAGRGLTGPRGGAVVVRLDGAEPEPPHGTVAALGSLPLIVIAVGAPGPGWRNLADVIVPAGDPVLEEIIGTVEARPVAATSLAVLLRGQEHRPVPEGLAAESAVYSALQAGPEFAAWRRTRPVRERPQRKGPRVLVERDGDVLLLTLDRPEVRNAVDAALSEELVEACAVAAADPTIGRVELRGAGPAFCAGGDLEEFGSRPDPATAHLIRLHRSAGRALWEIRERTTVFLHGACYGSGIELPAFAGTVLAAPGTRIALPEVALGLVPGAGGTVSVTARAGRHRTAWLALSGRSVDAATALEWGLVDAVTEDGA